MADVSEDYAADVLRRVIAQGRAAEFMHVCVWGEGMFTLTPEGEVVIIGEDTAAAWLNALRGGS